MKNLQILTNNHLGNFFWEQRTGLIDSVQLNQLSIDSFNHQLKRNSKFILLDFYFSKIPLKKELQMISKIKTLTNCHSGELKLFILSPRFADSELTLLEIGNKVIVTHNFTTNFLRRLLNVGNKNKQIKAS